MTWARELLGNMVSNMLTGDTCCVVIYNFAKGRMCLKKRMYLLWACFFSSSAASSAARSAASASAISSGVGSRCSSGAWVGACVAGSAGAWVGACVAGVAGAWVGACVAWVGCSFFAGFSAAVCGGPGLASTADARFALASVAGASAASCLHPNNAFMPSSDTSPNFCSCLVVGGWLVEVLEVASISKVAGRRKRAWIAAWSTLAPELFSSAFCSNSFVAWSSFCNCCTVA